MARSEIHQLRSGEPFAATRSGFAFDARNRARSRLSLLIRGAEQDPSLSSSARLRLLMNHSRSIYTILHSDSLQLRSLAESGLAAWRGAMRKREEPRAILERALALAAFIGSPPLSSIVITARFSRITSWVSWETPVGSRTIKHNFPVRPKRLSETCRFNLRCGKIFSNFLKSPRLLSTNSHVISVPGTLTRANNAAKRFYRSPPRHS